MALTAHDLSQIKGLFDERFDGVDANFVSMGVQFAAVRGDIDALALATAAGFAEVARRFIAVDERFVEVLDEIGEVSEDVAVIKDVVKDHSFRLARLEHRVRPAD